MKRKFIIPSLVLACSTFFISCSTDETDEESSSESEITTAAVSGFLNSEAFTPATTHFTKGESFGDAGYEFKLFSETEECDEFQSVGDISFFIESDVELTVGEYDGNGPYFFYTDGEDFGTASYFGAEVIITEVTETTISGRVRGGDSEKGENSIDGAFTATLCQK
ncbi:hypothetical protein [Zobellia alginiliquefaciens]|uniref:hypothetical protein n=1 Tax=Zobellia alginiliquefaciens TaxID=3032586 RepID=UPI0023E41560|nr:hypothetical protein [Zobellia alginiliquefaciens]